MQGFPKTAIPFQCFPETIFINGVHLCVHMSLDSYNFKISSRQEAMLDRFFIFHVKVGVMIENVAPIRMDGASHAKHFFSHF